MRSYGRKRGINPRFELRRFEATKETLATSVSYENDAPGVFDQGAFGFCVASATAAVQMFYRKKRTSATDVISRSAIYSQAKYSYEPNDIRDDGLQVTDGLLVPKNFGFVLESEWGYPTDPSGQNTGNALQPVKPSLWNPSFEEASYLSVDTSSVESMMRAMEAKGPLIIGMNYPLGFENIGADGYCDPALAGEPAGGHCLWILAYDQNTFGGAFRIRNSWGNGFGANGDMWLPFDALTKIPQYWPDEAYCVSFPEA
jgi:C1A family cysteine protease